MNILLPRVNGFQLGWMLFYKNDAKKNEEEQELPVLKEDRSQLWM